MTTLFLMKQIKQFLAATVFYLILVAVLSSNTYANIRTGNGGTGSEAGFAGKQDTLLQTSEKIRKFFNTYPQLQELFPEFRISDLTLSMESVNFLVTRDELIDNNGVKGRTCLNNSDYKEIVCNVDKLNLIKKPETLFVLMLHEQLGIIGVEETSPQNADYIEGYAISKRLAGYVSKVSNYDLVIDADKDAPVVSIGKILERNGMRSIELKRKGQKFFFELDESGYKVKVNELNIMHRRASLEMMSKRNLYVFGAVKSLGKASGDAYKWCYTADVGFESLGENWAPAHLGAPFLLVGAAITEPLCAVIPGVPAVAGALISPIDGVATLLKLAFSKKAKSYRKIKRMFTGKSNIKAGSKVMDQIIEDIQSL